MFFAQDGFDCRSSGQEENGHGMGTDFFLTELGARIVLLHSQILGLTDSQKSAIKARVASITSTG